MWRSQGTPEPGQDQVLIRVAAAGVNRPDLLQRAGLYPPPEGAPQSLGLEIAGQVEKVGSGVTRFEPGDRVMALVPGGGYASHAVADEGSVMMLPDALSDAEGAAVPETAFTVMTNVFEDGGLKKGERLFVHGATSGIGTMAAALANAMGAECYGTAGTAEKVDAAGRLGFAKVWNYREEDWSAGMSEAGGCDVVLDMVGGDYVPRNLAMLRPMGRHVSIAFQGGMEATVSIVDIMRRRLTLTGSTLRARSVEEKSRLRSRVESDVLPLLASGKLKPAISLTVPFSQAEEAHSSMQEGDLIGKAVLTYDEPPLS
ncbi:NAD(P)H-quinone oxidoreductase [Parvularcula maris]|uniref:NAD(P)H-quinone oxidoreductase n=1 Tax=Parvularcula maris TaxID=2965077 RepID=A0A9X2LB93_9PROT|nr:NAD(P)H-quinone oxidoreductase [Parvularcula maris]